MPERYRVPLVLCYLEGKTRDEAAQHLGWTLGTLRGRLEKGRELLRSRLIRRGLTLGAALLGSSLANQATAAVPHSLIAATVQAAKLTLTSTTVPTGLVSAQVAALTKGGLKAMTLSKMKIAAGFLVALSALGGGAGALTMGTLADEPAQAQQKDSPPTVENPTSREAAPKIVDSQSPLSSTAPVLSVAFSPDGELLASGASDGNVVIWDVGGGKELRRIRGTAGEKAGVHCVKFSPDGRALAGACADHNVRVWDVATGKELAILQGHKDRVLKVAYSPDGKRLVAGGADHEAYCWDLTRGKFAWKQQFTQTVASIAFRPDGRVVAAASEDGTVSLFDPRTGKSLSRLGKPIDHSSSAAALAFSPDGKLLASGGEESALSLWEITSPSRANGSPSASAKELRRLAHDKGIMSVDFSPDGRSLASAGEDRTVRLWDLGTGKEVAVLKGHKDTVNSVAFSPDGSLLACRQRR